MGYIINDDCYEKTQSDPNQRQGTIHINGLNPLVITGKLTHMLILLS